MPSRRKDETPEEFRKRHAAYQREWQQLRRTTVRDGEGKLLTRSIVTVPKRETYERRPNTQLARRSTLVDAENNVIQQWLIEKPEDAARRDTWEEMARALAAPLPKAALIRPPLPPLAADLMACYPVGDHHLGMLAWKHETGDSYDLDIGERLLTDATEHLAGLAPPCRRAALVVLGDFMHYDSFDTVTPTNRNLLDADGRWPKLVSAAMRVLRRTIDALAARHGELLVIFEMGNHDPSSAIFLQIAFAHIYESNPRVTINTSPKHFHYFEFGRNLVGVHHGHGRAAKAEQLPLIMAADQPEAWGRTKHRYWWTGHVHHQSVKDFAGCSVESFRILPPADAYAANEGYRAQRDMKCIVLHAEYGEVARHTVNPSMLERRP